MKVENYKIWWEYPKRKRDRQKTFCNVEVCTVEGDVLVGQAMAKCMKTDEFDKETGRKKSLSRALIDAHIPKEERIKIWDAYRKLTLIPRW